MISAGKFLTKLIESYLGLETDASEIQNKWNIYNDYGVALEHIASIFNISRQGLTDDQLRRKILGNIAINSSLGSINDLINVFKIITNATSVRIITLNDGLFDVELTGDEVYNIDIINQIPAGGTGIGHIYLVDDNTFTFDDDLLGLDLGEMIESLDF